MHLLIKIGKSLMRAVYALLKLFPVQNRVLFISRQSDTPSIDITMLVEKIKDTNPYFDTVVLCKKLSGFSYVFHMFRQMYYLATSKVVVLDSYCIAASVLHHRESLLVIQMWHSVGTMKKFGWSILDRQEGRSSMIADELCMHKGYDYVFAAGEGYKDHLAEGFNVSRDIILTYPLPRTEALQDENYARKKRADIFTFYPQLTLKKNIVYAPTFRKHREAGFETALKDLAASIDFNRYNLILKAHPLTGPVTCDERIIIDDRYTSMDMLFAADIVISDYSCIIYEAAILKKPVYLYTYDFDSYLQTRDIYIDYLTEMPCPICRTAADLVTAVEAEEYDYDGLEQFLKKYVTLTGHETADIVNFIFRSIQ